MILRWLYRRFAAKFNDLMVEEYTQGIPLDAKSDLINLLDSQKDRFRHAVDFMAFQLHRRMATDPRHSERYQGMFIQLKTFDAMLKGRPDAKPITPAQVEKVVAPVDFQKSVAEAIEKGKKSNAQVEVA